MMQVSEWSKADLDVLMLVRKWCDTGLQMLQCRPLDTWKLSGKVESLLRKINVIA